MSNSNPSNYTTTYTQEYRHRSVFNPPPEVPAPVHFDGGHASRTLGYDGNPIVYNGNGGGARGRSDYRPLDTILTGQDSQPPQVCPVQSGGGNTSFKLPDNRYHIPGYQGFVPGKQYRHGDTYAKTTRKCNDVSSALYLEP